MEKGKRTKTIVKGEISLPEAMIQLIQSFLSGKEAARSTLLSKSWHGAWLTRPVIDLDQGNFGNQHPNTSKTVDDMFMDFAMKTMQRYQELKMKIESFRLRTTSCIVGIQILVTKLILNALNLGATDLDLELRATAFLLPEEVLRSKTLLTLALSGCEINGDASWSRLKSLSLDKVHLRSDAAMRGLISCCIWIEDLSISSCTSLVNDGGISNALSKRLTLSRMSFCVLRKLRSLYLEMVELDPHFFKCLSSCFPFLADLSIVHCHGYTKIKIASRSLERISFVQLKVMTADFDVPNIRVFSYVGKGLPALSVQTAPSRQWESCVSLAWSRSQTSLFFRRLKHMLMKLTGSKITLTLKLSAGVYWKGADEEPIIPQPPTIPIPIEKLAISEASDACADLLVRLFKVVRPKFITHCWVHASSINGRSNDQTLNFLCRIMMKESIRPNCFIPDQELFGKFELKQANAVVSRQKPIEWPVLKKPQLEALTNQVLNKQVICFKLRWGAPQFN